MLGSPAPLPSVGSTVILYFDERDLRAVVLEQGAELRCKAGVFAHDAMLATPYGSFVAGKPCARADPTPYAAVLRLTPELWTQCLRHRTQIIYATDIAVIVQQLRLRPGSVVAEAGTGSGSLTHSLARAVGPTGTVFTFDFHKARADEARAEFASHGLGDVVVSGWRDVCRVASSGSDDAVGANDDPSPGYGLPPSSVDAVFLDVPAPWLAVPNVVAVLRPGGAVCNYSPCIEQTQKFCCAIRATDEFHDLLTVESLSAEFEPVFPPDEGAAPPKRRHRGEGVEVKRTASGKGHSAYLTFARRRVRAPAGDAADTPAPTPVAP